MSDDRAAVNVGCSSLEPSDRTAEAQDSEIVLPGRLQAYRLVDGRLMLVGHYGDDMVFVAAEDVPKLKAFLAMAYPG